jgi:hypothetical protein
MKGAAQALDIPFEYIDKAMSQIGLIYCLSLAGGEITLCPDRVRYVLESAKKHNVRIKRLIITTNGVIMSAEILEIYREFMDFIEMPEISEIIISRDRFHSFASKLTEEDYLERKIFYEDGGKNKVIFQNVERQTIWRLGNCAQAPKLDYNAFCKDRQAYIKEYSNQYVAYGLSKTRPFVKMPLRHTGKCLCQIDLTATGYVRPNDYITYKEGDLPKNNNGHINDTLTEILYSESVDPYSQTVGQFMIAAKNIENISEQIKNEIGFGGINMLFVNKKKIDHLKELSLSFIEIYQYMRDLVPNVRRQINNMPEIEQKTITDALGKFEEIDPSSFDNALETLEKFV